MRLNLDQLEQALTGARESIGRCFHNNQWEDPNHQGKKCLDDADQYFDINRNDRTGKNYLTPALDWE